MPGSRNEEGTGSPFKSLEEIRLSFNEIRMGDEVQDVNYRGKYWSDEECAVPLGPCYSRVLYHGNFLSAVGLLKNLCANKNICKPLFFFLIW